MQQLGHLLNAYLSSYSADDDAPPSVRFILEVVHLERYAWLRHRRVLPLVEFPQSC